ncbi:MAG: MlaD family protein, partial [Candidatus Competibacterales bacterium]|nr:MlaD family protein [Candidatus Competibacterales bacterium]
METRVSYTLVGLFVILLGTALVAAALWLVAGGTDTRTDTYRVYVRESVAGLNPKATVRYRGVDVGQVESIRLDPDDPRRVILRLEIQENTPIREDTVATLTTQGLTGLATVELSGGSPDSPPLEPTAEQPYPVIRSTPSLVQRLDDAFNTVLNAFNALSQDVDALLSPANQQAFGALLNNLSTVSGVLAGRADQFGRTLENLENVTAAIAGRTEAIDAALRNTATVLENSARASAGLNQLLARLNASVGTVDEMARSITAISRRLEQVAQASSRDLQQVVQRTTPELTR